MNHIKLVSLSALRPADSTRGPQRSRKDYVNEKFQWYNRESTSSGMPQPTVPPRVFLRYYKISIFTAAVLAHNSKNISSNGRPRIYEAVF